MLGLNNARINQLEAENRVLRAESLAQVQRIDALCRIIETLQRQNEAMARQCYNMAATTQQAQAAHGYVPGDSVLDRLCWN